MRLSADLVSAESALGEAGSNYPRPTRDQHGFTLSSFLNAQVYKSTVDANGNVTAKGDPMWEECKNAAKRSLN